MLGKMSDSLSGLIPKSNKTRIETAVGAKDERMKESLIPKSNKTRIETTNEKPIPKRNNCLIPKSNKTRIETLLRKKQRQVGCQFNSEVQ